MLFKLSSHSAFVPLLEFPQQVKHLAFLVLSLSGDEISLLFIVAKLSQQLLLFGS